jgi:hypothetical protein
MEHVGLVAKVQANGRIVRQLGQQSHLGGAFAANRPVVDRKSPRQSAKLRQQFGLRRTHARDGKARYEYLHLASTFPGAQKK